MTAAHPVLRPEPAVPERPTARPSLTDRIARIAFALATVALVAGMIVNADAVRAAEAGTAALWMDLWVDRGVTAHADTFRLWVSEDHLVAFQITAECTAIILLAPILLLGAGLMLSTRIGWARGIAGIAASAALMILVNQIRLAVIAWSTLLGGLETGYEIGHRLVGSAVGIAGFVLGLIVLIAVTGVRRRRGRRRCGG